MSNMSNINDTNVHTVNNTINITNTIVKKPKHKKQSTNIEDILHEHEHNIIKTKDFKDGEVGYRGNMVQEDLKTNILIDSLLE
tara:strand:- start:2435 stop:2683 length:249 start_codon:yes stop_codon:yes gene_type:complete